MSTEKLPITQHGFLKLRSCLSKLIEQQDYILRAIENGEQVDVSYSDIQKCFDRIDIPILCGKLGIFGIKGKIHKWLKIFVSNRTFQVRVNNTFSNETIVKSGIPQGSVLGPLLMLIMNFDMDKYLKSSEMKSFADDAAMMKGIKSKDDNELFQEDLKAFPTDN